MNTPTGGSTTYGQSVVAENGTVFVLAQQPVSGADHTFLLALDESGGLAQLARWDLGAVGFAAGSSSPSVASGVVYAPVGSALIALHQPPVQPLAALSVSPLTLSPTFAPSTFNYTIPCASGTNSVSLTMSAISGGTVQLTAPTSTQPTASQSDTVTLNENNAAVIDATDGQGNSAQYWIRCLPHDFPPITATRSGAGPSPGWYVASVSISPQDPQYGFYAMVLDSNGTPVWYKKGSPDTVNLTPFGHDSLAFMPSAPLFGYGTDPNGAFDLYDLDTSATTPQQMLRTASGPTDLHELFEAPDGSHFMASYELRSGVDLTGLPGVGTYLPPGPNSTIADCVVQDLDTHGNVVWQWDAYDHVDPVKENANPAPATINNQTVWDVYHCNSIDTNGTGDVLVSMRNASAVYDISQSDGNVKWKLGGTPYNKDGAVLLTVQNDPGGGFNLQHDARFAPNGHVTLYDNEDPGASPKKPSRAVEYALDLTAKTAQPVFSFADPANLPSCCMGDFRRYPDGESVIGWGFVIFNGLMASEINAHGADVLDLSLPAGYASYRTVKVPPTTFDVDVLRRTAGS
ncbi:MAG: aryl-sulfate sulfotransferase [Actinobacteria bacterium]|nr:aryl-sulfate sulfotransferase [Actinomycetota bacterium]